MKINSSPFDWNKNIQRAEYITLNTFLLEVVTFCLLWRKALLHTNENSFLPEKAKSFQQ